MSGDGGFFSALGQAQQAILREQAKTRWWYVASIPPGTTQLNPWLWSGPFYLNDSKMYQIIKDAMAKTRGLQAYRLAYSPMQHVWIWDLRDLENLRDSSRPIPGYDEDIPSVSGDKVGVTQITPPVTGMWPYVGFPPLVNMLQGEFRLAKWKWPKYGVVAQYRETKPKDSRHLYVLQSGNYVISHSDEVNPDLGSPFDHFIRDVVKRPATISPLEDELRRKAKPL